MTFDLRNQVCIVGVGESEFGRVLNDQSPIRLQVTALRAALEDAGLHKDDIDGFDTSHGAPMGTDYDEFVAHAGLNLRWVNQNWTHGRWAGTSIAQTALALAAGLCNYAVIINTVTAQRGYLKYFGSQRAWSEGLRDATGGQGQVDFHGLDTPGSSTSLVARDYMRRYGATSEELGTVAVTFRKHATMNQKAIMHDRPMTLDDYLESRFISPPFRLFDYCLTNEGSVCLILTTVERARALKKQPVFISGLQGIQASRNDYIAFARPGLGVGMQAEFDYVAPRSQVYDMANVTPKDIDALFMYDSFSTNLWLILERFGFCGDGEAHTWIQGGRIELGGELPVNTNGGLMSEGHYAGYNHIAEMVRQLRGECGERQVRDAEVLQWASPFGDSVILTKGQ